MRRASENTDVACEVCAAPIGERCRVGCSERSEVAVECGGSPDDEDPNMDMRWAMPADWMTYAIGVSGFVKIGRALNVAKRMMCLQTGNPHKMTLLGVKRGDSERDIHAWLESQGVPRVSGEWFEDGERTRHLLWAHGLMTPPF